MGIIAVDALFVAARVDEEASVGVLLNVHTKNVFTRFSKDTFMIRHQTRHLDTVSGISHVTTKRVSVFVCFYPLKLQ